MDKVDLIKARLQRATKGRWHWWTSNSWRRLKSEMPDYECTDVLTPTRSQADGHPDCAIRESDMVLIENAPGDLGYLLNLTSKYEKMLLSYDVNADIAGARRLAAEEKYLG